MKIGKHQNLILPWYQYLPAHIIYEKKVTKYENYTEIKKEIVCQTNLVLIYQFNFFRISMLLVQYKWIAYVPCNDDIDLQSNQQ